MSAISAWRHSLLKTLLGVTCVLLATGMSRLDAADSTDGLWTARPAQRRPRLGVLGTFEVADALERPTFDLALGRLTELLTQVDRGDSATMTLPLPDGEYASFRVTRSQVTSSVLASKIGLRTYAGTGTEDPTLTARFEVGPEGLSAMIWRRGSPSYVDPIVPQQLRYVAYRSARRITGDSRGFCQVRYPALARRPAPLPLPSPPPTLRTYRLAVGATAEYTDFFGGAQPALRAIGHTVNRVSGIYERELGVAFTLVDREDELIESDATAQGAYNNTDADAILSQNQAKLDHTLGSGNYDLGHVFSTGSGGLAGVGVACRDGNKGRGTTGRRQPQGDPFDVDYVAHEMGHQLGANHTFNAITGSCSGGTRNAGTAYEPGSGSTIMAYAGICDRENLQDHSDDYFHAASLTEIAGYLAQAGGKCGMATAQGGKPPSVTIAGGNEFHVPKQTAFEFNAVDPVASDEFTWEQLDLGDPAPPDLDKDGKERPLFRSWPSANGPLRLPRPGVAVSLGNGPTLKPRTLHFRMTARDPRGHGLWTMADVAVHVEATGPLRLTKPTRAASWRVGTTEAVTWDVGGTDTAPIGAPRVRILLSPDNGRSFSLVAEVPNTGSASVTVPVVTPGQVVVRIVPVGTGIFFSESEPFTLVR
jgi:hypothetical protein